MQTPKTVLAAINNPNTRYETAGRDQGQAVYLATANVAHGKTVYEIGRIWDRSDNSVEFVWRRAWANKWIPA